MLPARLPNLLLNGASGIAVGMATDIPPHNLREIGPPALHLLDDPEATTRALASTSRARTCRPAGRSSRRAPTWCVLRQRQRQLQGARDLRDRGRRIVITRCRSRYPAAKVLEQIAQQMRRKSCRWSRICATNPITRIRPGW
jgi:topoisomerase-4 subunit A